VVSFVEIIPVVTEHISVSVDTSATVVVADLLKLML